jgi:hypothetical protein
VADQRFCHECLGAERRIAQALMVLLGLEMRRSPAALPTGADLRPLRRDAGALGARLSGEQGGVPLRPQLTTSAMAKAYYRQVKPPNVSPTLSSKKRTLTPRYFGV